MFWLSSLDEMTSHRIYDNLIDVYCLCIVFKLISRCSKMQASQSFSFLYVDLCIQNGFEKLVVGADYIKLIWVPDTFFVNEKEARFHAATQVLIQTQKYCLFSSDSFKQFNCQYLLHFNPSGCGERKVFATNTFRCSLTKIRPSRNIPSERF